MKKKIVSLFLCIVIIFSFTPAISANNIVNFMTQNYNEALRLSGREKFDGYCATCVKYQLVALGVDKKYVTGDGNQVYNIYSAMNKTTGGYTVNSYPASSYSLSDFINFANNKNTSGGYTYIALGFEKGWTGDGQDFGHTLLIYSVSGGIVYYTESTGTEIRSESISDFCWRYRSREKDGVTVYQYEGAVWFTNGSQYTEAPSNAILSINKENFLLGETFTLTCEADSYCEYYMSIIDVDSGQVVDSGGISGTYSNSFQRAGHYTAYVTAYNSQGSINSNWVDFYFFGAPPTVANLSVNKSKLCLGESIEFNTYTNAYYSKIYMTIMAEKGDVVYSGNIPYQFEYIPSEGGVYYTHITAYTHEGGVDSNHISFEVYDSAAINPKITSNKTVISTGENIIFNFEADFATNYVLGIDKKGYGRISTPNVGTDSSYTTSFLETGIYSVYATCYNELGGCDSSKIEFIVIDEKSTFCIQNSDSVRITKKINGNSNNYSCIIALYQNRKLVKYLNKPNLNGTTILDETILCSDEYDEIKVMVWNGLSTLKPLCDAEVIPHTEFIIE